MNRWNILTPLVVFLLSTQCAQSAASHDDRSTMNVELFEQSREALDLLDGHTIRKSRRRKPKKHFYDEEKHKYTYTKKLSGLNKVFFDVYSLALVNGR